MSYHEMMMHHMMAGWKVVSTWVDTDRYGDWELHQAVVYGLGDAQVRAVTDPSHPAYWNIRQGLSELTEFPLQAYSARYAGDWYCNGLRVATYMYEATGCVVVSFDCGRDV